MPSRKCHRPGLRSVSFSNNFLQEIPTQFSIWTNISTFDVSSNSVKKQTAAAKCTALTDINAQLNDITTLTAGLTTRSLGSLNLTSNTLDETVAQKATKNTRSRSRMSS